MRGLLGRSRSNPRASSADALRAGQRSIVVPASTECGGSNRWPTCSAAFPTASTALKTWSRSDEVAPFRPSVLVTWTPGSRHALILRALRPRISYELITSRDSDGAARLQLSDRDDQGVNLLAGIVERQRRAHCTFQSVAAQGGLGAVMSRADSDAFLVQGRADILRAEAVEDEGQNTCFFPGCADEAQTVDFRQSTGGVLEQLGFVPGDILDADAIEVVDSGAQSDRIGDVTGACLESGRWRVVDRALEGDVGNHVAAALPGCCR